MAFRLAGGSIPPMPEQMESMSDPAVMPGPEMSEMPALEMMGAGMEPQLPPASGGLVSPEAAKYMTSDMRCGSCVHYMDAGQTGSCEIVSGPIDPQGVCLLYTADVEPQMMEPMPEEPVMGEEIPEDTTDDTGAEGAVG